MYKEGMVQSLYIQKQWQTEAIETLNTKSFRQSICCRKRES